MPRPVRLALLLLAVVPPLAAQAPARAPLSTFAYDARTPVAAGDSLRQVIDGIEVREVWFDSPKGGRVTGLLYLPGAAGRRPAVLVGHGAPGDARGYATMTAALATARLGAVALAIDAPFARRRQEPLALSPADSADRVQYIVDWRRAVDYLVARPDVDAARIGYLGNSFGGATGVLLAGVEPRIAAFVLRVADGGFVSHFTAPCTPASRGARVGPDLCLHDDSPLASLDAAARDAWYRASWAVEPIRFVAAARAPMLLQNGRQDPAVLPASAQRLHDAAPAHAVREWYDSGHRLPNAALVAGMRFLAAHIGLAEPGAEFERSLTVRTTPPPSPAPPAGAAGRPPVLR